MKSPTACRFSQKDLNKEKLESLGVLISYALRTVVAASGLRK